MRKFRKIAAGVAALTASAVGFPATAQTDVPVSLETIAGSRTIVVEDMLGNPLTELDFGRDRELPFRVRVQDTSFAPTQFQVNASLTNLYLEGPSGLSWSTKVPSANVKLEPQVNPINASGVVATVQPVVNLVTDLVGPTLSPLCALISGDVPITGGCRIELTNVAADVIDVTVPLTSLAALPLVPQAPATGFFTDAEYAAGVGLNDQLAGDGPDGRLPGTQHQLVAGQAVSASAVVASVTAAVDALPIDQVISDEAILDALNDATGIVGVLTNPLLPSVDAIVGATVATVNDVTGGMISNLTGQYVSLPKLSVTVPGGLPTGTYQGTLVVTGLQ